MTYEELKQEAAKYQDSMTDFERIKAYSHGKEVDRIPLTLSVGENQAHWYGYTNAQYRASAQVQMDVDRRVMEDFGCGGMKARLLMYAPVLGKAFGSPYNSPENAGEYVTEHLVKDYSELESLSFDPANAPGLKEKVAIAREIVAATEGKCRVTCSVVGPMTGAIALREPSKLMRDLKKDKEKAHKLIDLGVQSQLKWLEYVLSEFKTIGLSIFEPASSGSMISLDAFREFSRPHMEDLLSGIKRLYGRVPSIGIMGKTSDRWADLAEMGFPSFLVDGGADLAALKAAVGDKMGISGNVPPVDVMLKGSIDDVIEAVKTSLIQGSDSPCGYTLSIGGPPPAGIPKENMEAYVYAARRYGRGAKKGRLCRGLVEEDLA